MERLLRVLRSATRMTVIAGLVTLAACGSEREPPSGPVGSGAPAAKIVCDGTTTTVKTPVVETTREGVVFEVEVPEGSNFGFTVKEAGRGDNAETGPFVWVVPPGIAHLRCLGPGQSSEVGDVSTYEIVRIVDPDGIYKTPELGCVDAQGLGMSDGPAAPGEPEEQAIDLVKGLRPDDVVERAAYPGSRDEATVRVVRDGAVVAAVEFEGSAEGWIYLGFSSCPDVGLGV